MSVDRYCTLKCDGCKHRSADGSCVYEYDANRYESQFRWKGEGDPPRSWMANGTKVYRSFSDYCD